MKSAVVFVFRPGKNAYRADVISCTGWVRHAGRFRESRTYEFTLEARLPKGTVEVTLLDRKKRQLLKLAPASPTGKIEPDPKSRYYLRRDFQSATGKYRLHW